MTAEIERVILSPVADEPESQESEVISGPSLRPQLFDDYPGQEAVKENLRVYVQAARKRQTPLDHSIFHGPPGLGKTTLAKIVANELGAPFYQTSGPSIDKPGDLAGILAGIEPGGVLFVDEIHRLPITVEEVLYSAMEDFCVDILVGQGPATRTVRMPINPFTLIGATTRIASISAPLISRFGIQEHLDFYSESSLAKILMRSASIWDIPLAEDGAMELAHRSRGTPRIANRLLRRVRDFADFHSVSELHRDIVDLTLSRLDIDQQGLDRMDRRILYTIRDRYRGGPVGIETLAATVGEERTTIEDVYEPYLTHKGLIQRGPRGRELSEEAINHLENCDQHQSLSR
ncbi:Holliday junction branch migration DNA helicase RuvB [Pseudobacteriovorax antillogorgiicola]|uniref:Holliday junction branch migration complex subunit RuvB n=1 Tax=Pseudobacteriovorax antillogorgiicola TaxID=1513793 RepID=A0A1Y6B2U1_9BACT|nr:Holliday junction branch migration DNA helicase RuvB [Pseudobacteriovorax antillogorgiicola]TCS59400.1 Holliday junction DNA helicase subunit RuvB [Pseudobacteriovorax antillogorgiicola]SME88643.1 Holliday junction DNA helicase subunit RuvB [Pseudobacteriovorax antillogorgiicola]